MNQSVSIFTISHTYLVLPLSVQSDALDDTVRLDPQVDGAPGHGVEHPADLGRQKPNIDLEESLGLTKLSLDAVLHAQEMVSR